MPVGGFYQRRRNPDGTRNVYCPRCGRYIGTLGGGMDNFGSATCALCVASDNGEEVSAEVYETLANMQRYKDGTIASTALVEQKPVSDPLIGTEFKVGYFKYWRRVISSKVAAIVKAAIDNPPESKKLAKEKKRRRIFDQMDIEEQLNEKNKE